MKSGKGGHCWAFVLAGGEGSRLRSLTTTPGGVAIPKQFCSLHGGSTLLREALDRASCVAVPERIRAIVAAQHSHWWSRCLTHAQVKHSVVQPANCGTASGVLLPLLKTLDQDPDCTVVVLPSDHHVDNEGTLARALRQAVAAVRRHHDCIMMLGVEPDEPDPELGYIVPDAPMDDGVATVATFAEKPDVRTADDLIRRGALWNSFIFAARGSALLGLFERNAPELLARMRRALQLEKLGRPGSRAIDELYRQLSPLDFSRHIVSGQELYLRVVKVPHCGWSDLGTPKSVATTLRRLNGMAARTMPVKSAAPFLDLAVQPALDPILRRAPMSVSAGDPAGRTT